MSLPDPCYSLSSPLDPVREVISSLNSRGADCLPNEVVSGQLCSQEPYTPGASCCWAGCSLPQPQLWWCCTWWCCTWWCDSGHRMAPHGSFIAIGQGHQHHPLVPSLGNYASHAPHVKWSLLGNHSFPLDSRDAFSYYSITAACVQESENRLSLPLR